MCCGSKRLDAARNAPSPYAQAAPRASLATGHAGGPAEASAASAVPASSAVSMAMGGNAAMAAGGAVFVHDGAGELVVTGPKTGRRYRFAGRGARLVVDAGDVPAVAQVQNLRRLA